MPRNIVLYVMAVALGLLMAFGIGSAGAKEGCMSVAALIENGEKNKLANVHIKDERRLKIFAAIAEVIPNEAGHFTEDFNAIVLYGSRPGILMVFNEKDGETCRYVRITGPYAYAIMHVITRGKSVEPAGLGI